MLFALASVVLMTLDHRFNHLDRVRAALSWVIDPLRYAVTLPAMTFHWAGETLSSRDRLLDANRRLNEQNLLLRGRMQKFAAMEAENMRLRELLESSFKVGDKVLVAELLKVALEPFTRQIVINKGSGDQVFAGQPLVDAEGVVGQVVQVNDLSSIAMLITDPGHALPVQLNRNGLRAIAVGTGASNRLELLHIPNNADVRKGDLLVTSGLGGRFPGGYPVGSVVEVANEPGQPFQRVMAEASAHLQRNREVLLVWPANDQRALKQAGAKHK